MAPRSVWNGTITFGMVSVPVKLYTATESKSIQLPRGPRPRTARGSSTGRSARRTRRRSPTKRSSRASSSTRASTSSSRRTRSRPRPVTAARWSTSTEFVEAAEIDPVFYEKTYYVGSRDEADSYRRSVRGAEEDRQVPASGASPSTTASTWSRSARPRRRRSSHTMRFHDEVVEADDLELGEPSKKPVEEGGRDGGEEARRDARRRTSIRRRTRTPTARRCST